MNIQELLRNKIVKILGGIVIAALIIFVGILIYQKNINKSVENANEQNNNQTEENDNNASSDNNPIKPTAEEIKSKITVYDVSNLNIVGSSPAILTSYKTKFNEFKTKLLDAINKYEADKKDINKPEPDYFIELARYANYLGQKDWAKTILLGTFEYYDNSSVAWNNLAVIYEEEGNYLKANEYYLKTLTVFTDKELWGLYYNIAKNCKFSNDMECAHIYYAKYKARGGFDGELEEYLVKYFPKS